MGTKSSFLGPINSRNHSQQAAFERGEAENPTIPYYSDINLHTIVESSLNLTAPYNFEEELVATLHESALRVECDCANLIRQGIIEPGSFLCELKERALDDRATVIQLKPQDGYIPSRDPRNDLFKRMYYPSIVGDFIDYYIDISNIFRNFSYYKAEYLMLCMADAHFHLHRVDNCFPQSGDKSHLLRKKLNDQRQSYLSRQIKKSVREEQLVTKG